MPGVPGMACCLSKCLRKAVAKSADQPPCPQRAKRAGSIWFFPSTSRTSAALLGRDLEADLLRDALVGRRRRARCLRVLLEVLVGGLELALSEVRQPALELRVVVVLAQLERLGERLDRLRVVELVEVGHAED